MPVKRRALRESPTGRQPRLIEVGRLGSAQEQSSQRQSDLDGSGPPREDFRVGLGRAFAGALIFSLPMLMTMEMWWLGFYMDRLRLTLFILLNIPMLIGLSHYSGFEQTVSWKDDVIDAFVAYAVGSTASAIVLVLFGVLTPDMSLDTILGKVALQVSMAIYFAPPLANEIDPSFLVHSVVFCISR